MNLSKLSDGVYRAAQPIGVFGPEEHAFLLAELSLSPLGRVRINMHADNASRLHEMFIAIQRGSYVHPHKHIRKSESFHIVQGALDVVLFHDDGRIRECITLSDSGRRFYRLSDPIFHTLLIRTEVIVMHEVTDGPFDPTLTLKASFAPDAADQSEALAYLTGLAVIVQQAETMGTTVGAQ